MNRIFASLAWTAISALFAEQAMSADAPTLVHQQCLGLKFLNPSGSPLEVQNTCSFPIELKYCLTDHPNHVKGDTQATCLNQGIRTTGKIATKHSITILRNVVFPSTADGQGMAGIYFQGCNMSQRGAICHIAQNNQPPFSNGNDYKLLSIDDTNKLEGAPNSGKRNSDRDLAMTSRVKYYIGISHDGIVYFSGIATSEQMARQDMEENSSRVIEKILRCNGGWFSTWELEIFDRREKQSSGAACGAESYIDAINAALKGCQTHNTDTNCLSSGSNYSWRLRVSAGDDQSIESGRLNEVKFGDAYRCIVIDGKTTGTGVECNIKNELRSVGVKIND